MTEVPKIVHDRLRAISGPAAQPLLGPEAAKNLRLDVHPDADLLTAFAEQALAASERNGIIEHLAQCGECREVVCLALPAEVPQTRDIGGAGSGLPVPHRLNFASPGMRWGAMFAAVAAVAVVGSVLLVYDGKLNHTAAPSSTPASQALVSPASPGSAIVPTTTATPSPEQLDSFATNDKAQLARQLQLSNERKVAQSAKASPQEFAGTLVAGNGLAKARKEPETGPSERPRGETATATPSDIRETNETVEVAKASPAGETSSARLTSLNEAPAIERAKPVPPGLEADQPKQGTGISPANARLQARNMIAAGKVSSSAGNVATSAVTWKIMAGVLQRSLDGGQSWQIAERADHALLCYASRGEEVWTGGEAGVLFHSTDGGVTWVRVQPSTKSQQLSSNITRLALHADNLQENLRGSYGQQDKHAETSEIEVDTINNEVWISPDSGKSWNKE
jgi:hypothetical protein